MQEKIIDKLRKLHAHKESAESIGSIAEAEAFAARISQLLAEHKLEMSDIKTDNKEVEEEIEGESVDLDALGIPVLNRRDPLMLSLANIVAKSNFCLVIGNYKGNKFKIIGKQTDRQITTYIFHLLYRASREMAETEYRKEYYKAKKEGREEEMKGFKKAYLHGFNIAISERLRRQEAERPQEQGIILRSELDKVIKWGKQHIPTVNKSSAINTSNSAAKDRGYSYGKSVSINVGLNGGCKSTKMLGN